MDDYVKFINQCQRKSLALTGCSIAILILGIYATGGSILWPILVCTIVSPFFVWITYGIISSCILTVFRCIGMFISQIVILAVLLTFVQP